MTKEELLHQVLVLNLNHDGSSYYTERNAFLIKKAFAEFNGTPCDKPQCSCEICNCDHRCGFNNT